MTPQPLTADESPSALGRRRAWFGLVVLMLPVILVSMDFSVLYLAMPTIAQALHPSATQELWILDVYGFLIAGLLMTMGNLGDRIGRRRILLIGAAVFGIASVAAAFAPNAAFLIGARALMGIGGATLMPASLSLIANMFPHPADRARAIGIWTAAFAGGAAIGPVIGGFLLHHYWWGVVFLINVPVIAALFVFAPFLLPEYRARSTHPFDILGVVLSLLGILPIVYAVKDAAAEGISIRSVVIGLFGATMIWLFLRHQKRTPAPLVNLRLFSSAAFSACIAVALFGMMAQGGMAYLTNVYLQSVQEYDVLAAALAGIPMAITIAVFSVAAARVARFMGVRRALTLSLLLAAAGNLGILSLGVHSPLWIFLVLTAISGIGYGIQFALVSDVVVGSAPPEQSGAASGVSETSFELGTALGLALFGSLATAVFLGHSDGRFADSLGETLDHVGTDSPVALAAKQAFVDGMHAAALAGGIALLVLSVVVAYVMRGKDAVR
ncbi:MFS transporter [Gordonia sp. (in: high G+C Gram-positive bacteria)]|uniref:MFS transporter n=1 Tax=Gordonia sp. (in: high G+C Gram-positive bacteria) TaxID=84139 RepID=UPI0035276C02